MDDDSRPEPKKFSERRGEAVQAAACLVSLGRHWKRLQGELEEYVMGLPKAGRAQKASDHRWLYFAYAYGAKRIVLFSSLGATRFDEGQDGRRVSFLPTSLEYIQIKVQIQNETVKISHREIPGFHWLGGIWRARGEVVICLDSHVEATPGWLEPLLWRIGEETFSLESIQKALSRRCIYAPVAHSGGGTHMVGTTIQHKEHTMRTLPGYIPGAMSTQTDITMILPSPLVEWSVLDTSVLCDVCS